MQVTSISWPVEPDKIHELEKSVEYIEMTQITSMYNIRAAKHNPKTCTK